MRLESSKFIAMLTEMEKSSVFARDLEGRTIGSVRGEVVDIKDPERKGRVKVIIDGFKEDEEESYSHWVDVQTPFRGLQSQKLLGSRVTINPTYSDLNRAVISSVIYDEEEGEIPGVSTMNRSPIYDSKSQLPEPCKENHGCILIQDRFPINGDRAVLCLRDWNNTYTWHVLADLKRPKGGIFGGSFLGFLSGLVENGIISSAALSFATGGIGALVPGLTGLVPGLDGLVSSVFPGLEGGIEGISGNIIPGFGDIIGGVVPDLEGILSSGVGSLVNQISEITGISGLDSVLDMVTGALGLPSLSSLGDLVTSLPGISEIVGLTDLVSSLEGEIISGIRSISGEIGVDLASVLGAFSSEGSLPGFLGGELERLTGGITPSGLVEWFSSGIDSGSDYD